MNELHFYTAIQLARGYSRGKFSPLEVIDAVLARDFPPAPGGLMTLGELGDALKRALAAARPKKKKPTKAAG